MSEPSFMSTLKRRNDLVQRLMKCINHLPHEQQLVIITSWMSLDDLERCVKLQEEHQ